MEGDCFEAELEFNYSPVVLEADERVVANRGTCYVKYGPVIYVAEAVDNGTITDYALSLQSEISKAWSEEYNAYTLSLTASRGEEDATLKMIPYFAFANRGESDMRVYIKRK